MKVKPMIQKQGDKFLCYFEVDKEEALEISKKRKTHSFFLDNKDNRVKTVAQNNFFWAILDEFITEFKGYKPEKEEMNEIKNSLYIDYMQEKKVRFTLSKATITDAKLFIDYVITEFSEKYGFVSKNIVLQNEFNSAYVYSTLINGKCAVCGENGDMRLYKKHYICLCNKHKEMTIKELNEHYLTPIKLSDEIKRILY